MISTMENEKSPAACERPEVLRMRKHPPQTVDQTTRKLPGFLKKR